MINVSIAPPSRWNVPGAASPAEADSAMDRKINYNAMKHQLFTILTFLAMLPLVSCNKTDVIETGEPPRIVVEDSRVYKVKVGRELLLSPGYENAGDAEYAWSIGGQTVGTEPDYLFTAVSAGEVFVAVTVTTEYGEDSEEFRIDVVDLEIPTVSVAGADEGFRIAAGGSIVLHGSVPETSIPTTVSWSVDGVKVADTADFEFTYDTPGVYRLTFAAVNEDGADSIDLEVTVVDVTDMEVVMTFDRTDYHVAAGRRLRLAPRTVENADGAVFAWYVDGEKMQESEDSSFVFRSDAQGDRKVTVTATVVREGVEAAVSYDLAVFVCPPEGTYFRPAAGGVPDWTEVYEFTPAPGQFINEGYTAATAEEACRYAEQRLSGAEYVSLGGFGGYIVVGFDHSISNNGGYDIAITGNSFEGSSEPGIVWVMQDENGNGLPDDTWYELSGSDSSLPSTIRDYAVTYYRPRGAGMEVQWTDDRGGYGTIDYLADFHTQDFYYPAWIEQDSYTLRGTRLEAHNYDASGEGTYWINPEYEWGYADNYSPIDRLTDSDNAAAGPAVNHFRISDAVQFDGTPADLQYIDFVKVQTGVNAKSGWLGELSSEVSGICDYHLKQEN